MTEILNNAIVWIPIALKNFRGEKTQQNLLIIHLSLGKAGPFTLESHIHVKALKMPGFP